MSVVWGLYGDGLVPLVELNDGDTFTELNGCTLLLARPQEAKHAQASPGSQASGRWPHRSAGERRAFDLESIALFANEHGCFDQDNDRIDEPEDDE